MLIPKLKCLKEDKYEIFAVPGTFSPSCFIMESNNDLSPGIKVVGLEISDLAESTLGGKGMTTSDHYIPTDASVIALNDSPTVSVPLGFSIDPMNPGETTSLSGLVVYDPDRLSGMDPTWKDESTFTVSISSNHGLVQVSKEAFNLLLSDESCVTEETCKAATIVMGGSLERINQALQSLSYTALENMGYTTTVKISVNDRGNVGDGEPLVSSRSFPIVVLNPSTNSPSVFAPRSLTAFVGERKRIVGISVDDSDTVLEISVVASAGILISIFYQI